MLALFITPQLACDSSRILSSVRCSQQMTRTVSAVPASTYMPGRPNSISLPRTEKDGKWRPMVWMMVALSSSHSLITASLL